MTDKILPGVQIELGERTFNVSFTMYSLAKLKKVTGKSALKGELDTSDPDDLIYFLWAGLVSNYPEFDGDVVDNKPDAKLLKAFDEIGRLMVFDKLADIGGVIGQAFSNAMPKGKAADGDEKK